VRKYISILFLLLFSFSLLANTNEVGIASWYTSEPDGPLTANGEIFDPDKLTAAHKSLTFGTVVRVHNLEDNKSVDVTINDRGPFVEGRIIDLTVQGAKELGIYEKGIALVELEILHKPPYPVSNYNRLGDTGYYKIQIGSFSNYQTVQDLYEKLIKEDLIAELELVENNLIRLTIRWIEENRKDEILKTLNKLGIKEPLIRGDVNPLMVD
jgi:rare lipoprotein A